MGECMKGLTKIFELKNKNVINVRNEQSVMFDKRYQVHRTFFTVKHFPNIQCRCGYAEYKYITYIILYNNSSYEYYCHIYIIAVFIYERSNERILMSERTKKAEILCNDFNNNIIKCTLIFQLSENKLIALLGNKY